jgi:gem associated protein 5
LPSEDGSISAARLVSTGYTGELVLWIPDPDELKHWRTQKVVAGGHSRPIFSVLLISRQAAKGSKMLLTISMDRLIGAWNLETMKCSWTIPSLGGFVYKLAFAPSNPGRFAVAVGDKSIRIWRLGPLQSKSYDILFLWKGLRDKVTALCWHPTDDTKLAFGLEDGAVGIYTLSGIDEGATHRVLRGQHDGAVLTLGWPEDGSVDCETTREAVLEAPCLFSCGADGKILRWKALGDQTATDISVALGKTDLRRSCISFSGDKRVALANTDGSIHVYRTCDDAEGGRVWDESTWKIARILHEHTAAVGALSWQPVSSSKRGYLASGSDDCSVRVWDPVKLESGNEASEEMQSFGSQSTGCVAVLPGHIRSISGLAWCPHQENLLASSSLDGTAQVWKIDATADLSTAVTNMRGHESRVLCVTWSATEANILYTGADDQTVRKWDSTQQPFTKPPSNRRRKPDKAKSDPDAAVTPPDSTPAKDGHQPVSHPRENTQVAEPKVQQNSRRKKNIKARGLMRCPGGEPVAIQECVELAEIFAREGLPYTCHRNNDIYVGLEGAIRFVDRECKALANKPEKSETRAILEMWRGNVGTLFIEIKETPALWLDTKALSV